MARRSNRSNTSNSNVEAPAEATSSTEEEAPVTDTVTENDQPEAPAEAKPEADLTAFKDAATAAVAEADETTGDLPEASLANVTAEYRKLDGIKAKNAAKNYVNAQMKDAMNSGDLGGARAYLNISEKALVAAASGGGATKERTPADPTEAFVQRVATLNIAYNLAVGSVPEGVSEDWSERVNTLVSESTESANQFLAWTQNEAEDKGDEPEANAVVRNAVKLAIGKSARAGTGRSGNSVAYEGDRRDIAKHIVAAFEDKEDGEFLRIAEIRSARSDEYGDNPPSPGAISSRLFPVDKEGNPRESTMLKFGIRPDTQDGRKGAVKDSSLLAE